MEGRTLTGNGISFLLFQRVEKESSWLNVWLRKVNVVQMF